MDAAGQDTAEERIGLERRHQHAEGGIGFDLRRRHVAQDQVEQRLHVLVLGLQRRRRPALAGRREQGREIELLVARLEGGEQVEDLVMDLVGPGIGAVDLVDQHDRAQSEAQRLAQHELGLRQRAFGRVDQQHHAVDHREDALDLAAEIGVARRVDDIDARALPDDRRRLGEDGDATLTLEIVRVHGALGNLLVVAEGAALFQQAVDQRCLAMVDVRDNRDVTDVHTNARGFVGRAYTHAL